jgi:predicted amidohydrolase YtcJ
MPHPDLVITHARILTMDADAPRAGAVAVQGGRILAVGTDAQILALVGPQTRVINAQGRSLLPGFVESHMHLFAGGAELSHLQLAGVRGERDLTARVRAYAAGRTEAVILCQAVDYAILGDAPLTRHVLDRVLADRPLLLTAQDHHTMWANTAALRAAGILGGHATPPGSEVVMGDDGLATGELREAPAFGPVLRFAGADRSRLGLDTGGEPDPAPDAAARALDCAAIKAGLDHAVRHGITSITNMDGNLYTLQLLDALRGQGALSARVKVPFHFKNFMEIERLEMASQMARDWQDDWLSAGFVKLFMDGVIDSGTAVMIDDYPDQPGWRGEPLFAPAHFAEIATEIDRRGLQIAVHAIGDGAVRTVLDGYAAARAANGARDSRHRIEHIEVIHPDDIARFKALGVMASMQPPHPPGAMDFPLEPTISRIGQARWGYAYPWAALQRAGAVLAFASDWPVSDINPLRGIQAALTRQPWAVADPDQRIGLMATLAAYTLGGAYGEHAEDHKGMVRVGYLADLVLLSGDIEAVAHDEIGAMAVDLTICGGQITFDRLGQL